MGLESVSTILAAADLDELYRAVRGLGRLSATDVEAIRAVLERWDDTQALANLLMYPKLVPVDLRAASLLRGLRDGERPYLALAAAVGLARLDAGWVSQAERTALRDQLLAAVAAGPDLVAVRAAIALAGFIDAADLPRVLPCLGHPDDRVCHNLLVALAEHVPPDALDAAIARARDVPPGRVELLRARLKPAPPDTPISPYLPSLRACG